MSFEYVPCLKLKQNELRAINDLEDGLINNLLPLFDLPRDKDMDVDTLNAKIKTALNQLERSWDKNYSFYLDIFDIDLTLNPNKIHVYEYVLNSFIDFLPYPVVGLDRDPLHSTIVKNYLDKINQASENRLAVRLLARDYEYYELTKYDLDNLIATFSDNDVIIDFIIDSRNIFDTAVEAESAKIVKFINSLREDYPDNNIILTSCSIPARISKAVSTENNTVSERKEVSLYELVNQEVGNIVYGDYAVISPEYQDVPQNIILNVSSPKIIYTDESSYFIVRGGAFRTHPLGYYQYFDLAVLITSHGIFRGQNYSFGDNYIHQKSNRVGKGGNASSWIRATVNCHISFVLK